MAPSIRFINQTAPFWDFVASIEDQATDHPFFTGPPGGQGPWGRPHGSPWGQQIPHRGGPPPAPGADASAPAPAGNMDKEMQDGEPVPDPPEDTPGEGGPRGWRGHGFRRCGAGPRHHWRGFGPHGFGHPYAFGRRGGHPFGPRGFGFLSELFNAQDGAEQGDWKPEADVFDTEGVFVVHVSLPGANKEDIGVSWDPEKSELTIAGVVHRPGDEEFLKSLALDERHAGAFDRKVRLGTRASPAQVDVDGITAKLENGILIVEVPKLKGDFVDIKKVDIE